MNAYRREVPTLLCMAFWCAKGGKQKNKNSTINSLTRTLSLLLLFLFSFPSISPSRSRSVCWCVRLDIPNHRQQTSTAYDRKSSSNDTNVESTKNRENVENCGKTQYGWWMPTIADRGKEARWGWGGERKLIVSMSSHCTNVIQSKLPIHQQTAKYHTQ